MEMELENLRALKILGKGAMGTVFLVHDRARDPAARNPFALKVVDKASNHDADRRARWEIQVLAKLSHHQHRNTFLPSLLGSLETPDFLAWAVPYCPGGDLNVLRYRQNDRVFSHSVIKFYLAEIVCALDHLHQMGIVYRDLKPENILVQMSGHVTLTDFDLSRKLNTNPVKKKPFMHNQNDDNTTTTNVKKHRHRRVLTRWVMALPDSSTTKGLRKAKSARVSPVSRRRPSFEAGERCNSFVGTEEYVAPEVVKGDGHEFAVDWWALGVLTYEMLYGTTPFKGCNRKDTFRNVLLKKPEFVGIKTDLTDLIRRLLEKDPTKRLGYQRGAIEIKEHVFFKGVRWDLLTGVLRPPFIPSRDDGDLTLKVTTGDVDIKEYFQNLRKPPSLSLPPSPLPSPDCRRNVSFAEY
ncbi:Pkinase domain-containing protein [Cephalotus follicularis]|uniref:non-specific serine/threonine protein kinase n=1 Tax=Cephalotus follicularis TaxID=3775 RepID=A0A1Q3C917_CEPFO|nr:Pkinase domain-containing protein [Cephalotus follicularis]